MTYEDELQQVLNVLYDIRLRGALYLSAGICDNMECLLLDEDGDDLPGYLVWREHARWAFEAWGKFSGDGLYPVYVPTAPGTPGDQYHTNYEAGTLWEGVQGELREDLLDHLINYFTNTLEEYAA